MKCQANMVPSILLLPVIASVSGTILAKRTRPFNANVEAGIVANCENNINIGGANEDLVYAGEKSQGKECQAACQENPSCDFFVWVGPNGGKRNGCWLKQYKGQSYESLSRRKLNGALSGKSNCRRIDQTTATTATAEKCKFVPAKSTECSGLWLSRLPQCFADMSNGEFCDSNDKTLPDGNEDFDVNTCDGIWDIFKCVRGDYTVTEGACRTENNEDDDVFACDARIRDLSACKAKCNSLSECGAVSWDGRGMCCGLSKKARSTDETAWKCYSK